MKVRLNLSPIAWNHKPTGEDIAKYIKKDISNDLREITPEELITAIEHGQTFTAGVLTDSTAKSWQEQQLICIDIDNGEHRKNEQGQRVFCPVNDPMTPEEACEVMESYGIEPYFMYYTFSHETEGKAHGVDKFRIVVILDEPITDPDRMKSYSQRFATIFNDKKTGVADKGVHNLDRLYFGSIPGSTFRIARAVTSVSCLDCLPIPPPPPSRNRHEHISYKGVFDLRECLDYIDPDDREVWYKVGMALKYEDYSFDVWDEWASKSNKHDYKDSLRVWKSFRNDDKSRVVTGAYITKLAKDNGYIPPSQRPRPISKNVPTDWDDFML